MKRTHNPLAAVLGGLGLVLALAGQATVALGQSATVPAQTGTVETTGDTTVAQLTLDQARGLARHAFRAGNYRLANELAHGLLRANEDDVSALILLAATEPFLGRPEAGRKAGARAWRLPEGRPLRREIAFYTARAALREERYELAKLWLRRAYDTADTDAARNGLARDFQQLRAISPWSGSFSASFAPSSNLNGGSSWDWLLIDDRYVVGEMNADSQPLSGWQAILRGGLSYKLQQSASSVTSLGLDLSHTAAFLSNSARDQGINLTNKDLSRSSLRFSLSHLRDARDSLLPDSLRLSFGRNWADGQTLPGYEPSENFAALDIARTLPLGTDGRNSLHLQAGTQREWSLLPTGADRDVAYLRAGWQHILPGGSRLKFTFAHESARSDQANQDYGQWNIGASWSATKPVGPASLSLHLGWRERDYDTYYVGPFRAPNGRRDDEWSATVSFNFKQIDYMGFSPVLSLTASETKSNITRFETRASGLSLGFQSRF